MQSRKSSAHVCPTVLRSLHSLKKTMRSQPAANARSGGKHAGERRGQKEDDRLESSPLVKWAPFVLRAASRPLLGSEPAVGSTSGSNDAPYRDAEVVSTFQVTLHRSPPLRFTCVLHPFPGAPPCHLLRACHCLLRQRPTEAICRKTKNIQQRGFAYGHPLNY